MSASAREAPDDDTSDAKLRQRRSSAGRPEKEKEDDAAQSDGDGSRRDSCDSSSDLGPPGEEDEEEGEQSGADPDDDVEWQELYACPLTVRFTQDKVHPFFYRRGPIVNVVPKIRVSHWVSGSAECPTWLAGDPESDEFEVYELVPPFGPIQCLRKGEELWSLDNRRLYALQLAAMEHWPTRCRVRILYSDRLPRRKLKTQWRKMQTTNEGRSIVVAARYQQFDTWSWFDRAVEIEWYTLSHRLGILLNVFEVLPVIGALLFRTGLTGYTTRIPFFIGFLLSFGVDILRQRVTILERRLAELHVKAVMDGQSKDFAPCCRRNAEAGESALSAQLLAAFMAVVLLLLLPYIAFLGHEKLRRSMFSCWLGIACVLAVQCGIMYKNKRVAEIEYGGTNRLLTPKHRS
eukprot:TRINITY_DN6230_c0_g1_i1.p1 TRINITY_DN6230_c0_g1~~TRINITY_DN6230_c0_g1_i1.p1  ORF type:complete len:404 (+),score=67.50 TRINITY_DN6230_c0_g1_i1:182-1393(+)